MDKEEAVGEQVADIHSRKEAEEDIVVLDTHSPHSKTW